jgi:hypothetical protein
MGQPTDRQSADGDGPERGRFATRRTQAIVPRLCRGEPLEAVSRAVGVTAATLSSRRDQVLAGDAGGTMTRSTVSTRPRAVHTGDHVSFRSTVMTTFPLARPSPR